MDANLSDRGCESTGTRCCTRPLVLIVDSDPGHVQRCTTFLQGHYRVESARCGVGAVAAFEDHAVDCILLDFELPDMDAFELLGVLSCDYPDRRPGLVVVSAIDDVATAVQCLKSGANDYLVKSRLTQREVLHSVRNVLNGVGLKRQVARHKAELDQRRAWLEAAFESAAVGMLGTDADGRVTTLNSAGRALLAVNDEAIVGRWADRLFDTAIDDAADAAQGPVATALRNLCPVVGTAKISNDRRGQPPRSIEHATAPVTNGDGRLLGAVVVFGTAVAPLVGARRSRWPGGLSSSMPDADLMADRIGQAVRYARRHGMRVGVIELRLGEGLAARDERDAVRDPKLLRRAAIRAARSLRCSDSVCASATGRILVLAPGIKLPQDAWGILDKLKSACGGPYRVGGRVVTVSVGGGACSYPEDGQSAEELMRAAAVS